MTITMFDICKFYPIWLPKVNTERERFRQYILGGIAESEDPGCLIPQDIIEHALLKPITTKGITAKQGVKLGQEIMKGLERGLTKQ